MAFLILEQINTLQQKLKEWIVNLKPRKKDDSRLFYALEENAGVVHILQGEDRAFEFAKSVSLDESRVFKKFPDRKIIRRIPSGNIVWGLRLKNGQYTKLISHGNIRKTLCLEAYLGESNVIYFLRKDGDTSLDNNPKEIKQIKTDKRRIRDNRTKCLNILNSRIPIDAILREMGYVDSDFRDRLIPELEEALSSVRKKLSPAT